MAHYLTNKQASKRISVLTIRTTFFNVCSSDEQLDRPSQRGRVNYWVQASR